MNRLTIEPFQMSKSHFLLGLVFACLFTNAQVPTKDFQSWNSISVEKRIFKKYSILLDQDIRLDQNASMFKDYITVIGAHYVVNKYIKVRGLYRFTLSEDFEDGTSYEHRWYADGMLRYKPGRFIYGYRLRYQLSYEDLDANRFHHLRNRFTLKYDIPKSKILPYVGVELYYSLNDPIKNSVERSRYTAGIEYAISDYLGVSCFYRLQKRKTYGSKPYNRYILGLGASYEF